MQTRRLGNSDLDITRIGFGAWAVGGPDWAFAWGPQDDADSIAAIREALDCGVNWIDTAPATAPAHPEESSARAPAAWFKRPSASTNANPAWGAVRQIANS